MSNNISRKIQRSARNKSMRGGQLFRSDQGATKVPSTDRKAANRIKGKQQKITRRQNRG